MRVAGWEDAAPRPGDWRAAGGAQAVEGLIQHRTRGPVITESLRGQQAEPSTELRWVPGSTLGA